MGRVLVVIGLSIAVLGVILWAGERWLNRPGGLLPGDIHIQRGNFHFYFPVVTCIVLSAVLTLVLWLVNRGR